jgi:hypothetical protein
MRRVPDVADCWFDAGAMQLAQWHYPFENQDMFEQARQADFISEGVDQTRGWFYTLHALATLLFDRPAYKNVIALGILEGADGRRMSKLRGTAVNPFELLDRYGADAVRWYMFASAPPYNSRVFLPEHVGEMPFPAINSMFDALYPPGLQWYWRADFLNELGDAAIARHVEHGSRLPTMHSTVHLYPVNGVASRVREEPEEAPARERHVRILGAARNGSARGRVKQAGGLAG